MNKIKSIILTLVACSALALSGCAVLGGGQTDPILSLFVPKTLQDNATILAGNATQSCNAGAAKEYNINMVICGNPAAFVAQIPGVAFVTPAQIEMAISAVCATNGYTSSMPPTVTVGNCQFPAPTPATK